LQIATKLKSRLIDLVNFIALEKIWLEIFSI